MNLFKRLLAASGAAGLLIGLGAATPVFAREGFSATIALMCAVSGDTQTITVNTASGDLVHVEVTINGSIANGGTQTGLAVDNSFTDQWTVAAVSQTTTASVRVWTLSGDGVAANTASPTFQIHPAGDPCPSPNTATFSGDLIDVTQVGGTVNKTCDAGVTGNAVFTVSIQVNSKEERIPSTTINLPATITLPLSCNGKSQDLPVLPETSVITLHESTRPTGAAVAADTTITVGATLATTTIHNTKAAVATATPTPTARVLPATGKQESSPTVPWLAFALLGMIAATGAVLILRRRS